MKYIIPENRLYPILDQLIINQYGSPLSMTNDDVGYIYFYPSNRDVRIGENEPFERNFFGVLWINDHEFFNTVKGLFNLSAKETLSLIADYFSNRYNIKIDGADIESFEIWDNEL